MARKTVSVESVRESVNKALASSYGNADTRRGAIGVLETILFDTGKYLGFRYLATEMQAPDAEGNVMRPGYDDTRRWYY